MKLMQKDEYGTWFLGFSIGRFSFDWFTDCGEWFIYIHIFRSKYTRVIRFSGAGCYCEKHVSRRIDHA